MSNTELREMLANDYPDAVLIGNSDEVEKYFPAIVGIDYNNGRVIYDRDKLAECFASEDGLTLEEAADHICCNVDRSLPYMGGGRQYSCPQSKHLNRSNTNERDADTDTDRNAAANVRDLRELATRRGAALLPHTRRATLQPPCVYGVLPLRAASRGASL